MANIAGGSVVWQLDIDDSKFKSKLRDASSSIKGGSKETAQATEKNWGKMGAAMGAVAGVVQSVFTKAMDAVGQSVGSAIKRVDILNNFPKIMSNMGISSEESAKTIKDLSKSLQGLPTPLDAAALSVQRLTTTTGDVGRAKDIFLALNNAILAGGAPMELQASAMEQFSQSFARGKIDMNEWGSLMLAMPAQLDQLAKAMGQPNATALGDALRTGKISMSQFSDALVNLNKKGSGQFQSFEKQAKDSTGGIQTGIANMQTAIARGVANILNVIGQANISNAIGSIGKAFESASKVIVTALSATIGFFKDNEVALAAFVGVLLGIATAIGVALAPAIGGLMTALGGLLVYLAPFIAIGAAVGIVALLIKNNWEKISPVVDTVKNTFIILWQALQPIRNFIADQLKKAWDDLRASFEQVKKTLEPFFPQLKLLAIILGVVLLTPLLVIIGVVGAMIAIFVALTVVISRVIGWISRLVAWFFNAQVEIQRAVYNITKNVFNAFSNAQDWLYNAGRSLVQGLINGVKSMVGAVGNAISDVASTVKNKFKGMLGIHSPSKVFADFGANLGAGLAKGIDSSQGLVNNAVAGLAGASGSSINTQVNAVPLSDLSSSAGNTTVNVELNMSGIMARSRTDLRDIGTDMLQAVNEGLRAKGVAEIGGGAL